MLSEFFNRLRPCANALLAIFFVAGIAANSAYCEEKPAEPDAAALVQKLNDDNFDIRAMAAEKLGEMGEKAREALEAAARSNDIEVRFGAARILSRLSRSEIVYHVFDRNGKPIANTDLTAQMYDYNDPYQRNTIPPATITTNAEGTARIGGLKPGHFSVNTSFAKLWPVSESYGYGGNGQMTYGTIQLRESASPNLVMGTLGGAVKGKILSADGKPLKDATLELYHCVNFNPRIFEAPANDPTNNNQRQSMGNAISGADGVALVERACDGVYFAVATMTGFAPTIGPMVRVREGQTVEVPALTLTPRPDGKITFKMKGVPLTPEELADSSGDQNLKNKRQQLESYKSSIKNLEDSIAKLVAEEKAKAAAEEEAKKTASAKTGDKTEKKDDKTAEEVKKPNTMKSPLNAAQRKTALEASLTRMKERIKTLEEDIAKITDEKIKEQQSKTAKKDPNEPDVLKHVKMFIDIDHMYEGPDGEKRNRAALMEKTRRNRWNRNAQNETGDEGVINLDNLRPGKYRIKLKAEAYAPKILEAEVKAGGTVDLGEIVLDHGGSVTGKALMSDNKPVTDLLFYPIREDPAAVAETPQEVLGYIQGLNSWDEARSYLNWQRQYDGNTRYTDPKNSDKFLLKNLAPGTYSLMIACLSNNRFEQTFLVCGVKVEAGKTVELEPLKFTATAKLQSNSQQMIKGKVTGGESNAYGQGIVYYQYRNGSSSTSLNSDGSFSIYPGNGVFDGKLRVKVSGFKMAEVDCSKPGVDLANVQIKLEKIKYGKLRVNVVDEVGNPLQGAAVEPTPGRQNDYQYYNYNRMPIHRLESTNTKGEVSFSGLSIGSREIDVIKEGYFHADPIKVVIQPDTQVALKVVLNRGFSIKGKVIPPEGKTLDYQRTVLSVAGKKANSQLMSGVSATGEFEISGLNPDKYSISARSVLSMSLGSVTADLSKGSVADLKLELIQTGGIALEFDKNSRGMLAMILDKDSYEKKAVKDAQAASKSRQRPSIYGYVDETGRSEFFGACAGEYYLMLQNSNRNYNTEDDEVDAMYTRKLKCDQYFGPLKIDAVKSYPEMVAGQAQKVELPEANASATVRFEFTEPPFEENSNEGYSQRNYYVSIVGSMDDTGVGGGSRAQFAPPNRRTTGSSKRTGLRVQVVGEMPAYFKPLDGGKTLIQNMLPGKYKINCYSYTYMSNTGTQMQSKDQTVAEFEIKAGERKDLGVIKITPQKETINMNNSSRGWNGNIPPIDEDLEEAFEP